MSGPEWKSISMDAKDFIKKMIQYDPNVRISADEALKHSWIQKKVHEIVDLKATLNALSNLRNFRVCFPHRFIYHLGRAKDAISSLDIHSVTTSIQRRSG